MIIAVPLVLAAVTPLLHSLVYFLVAVLVALIVWWAIGQFLSDARIKNIIGAILALILVIYAITLFLPGL